MPQAREFDAKKAERQARDQRFYTVDLLGRPCPAPSCRIPVPKALNDAGFTHHPTCDPASREEMSYAHYTAPAQAVDG